MSERSERQVEQLLELLNKLEPEARLEPADEFRLMDVEQAAGHPLPPFLQAWLLRVGCGVEGVQLLDLCFDTMRLMSANELWAGNKRGFVLVALGVGFESYDCDYYYDLSRPSSPEAEDFEVVSFPRGRDQPPRQRDRVHGYTRVAPSLRELLGFAIFHPLRIKARDHQRSVFAEAMPPAELRAWMARLETIAEKSGLSAVGGLDGEWRLYDRGDASLELSGNIETGSRLVSIAAEDAREAELLAQRLIDGLDMVLVPNPGSPMDADRP